MEMEIVQWSARPQRFDPRPLHDFLAHWPRSIAYVGPRTSPARKRRLPAALCGVCYVRKAGPRALSSTSKRAEVRSVRSRAVRTEQRYAQCLLIKRTQRVQLSLEPHPTLSSKMPVFQETAASSRDLRVQPSRALPLPRTGSDSAPDAPDHREAVVVGAGPSGLFLTLLLARYGITGRSLLCLDSKAGTLKAGQADGLQPRTLEVLQSLGIASEILQEGCHMAEVAFWNPTATTTESEQGQVKAGIERTAFVPDVAVPTRFPYEVTIHQGRIERILQQNLALYESVDIIRRSHHFTDYEIDVEKHPEYPILVNYTYELDDGTMAQDSVRTKYLVGADGAHSKVRKSMGLELEGETSDHIWGVCDFVADTDFPDIRNRCAVHSSSGSVMIIPRERIATGEYLTRLYVHAPEYDRPQVEDEEAGDTGTKKKSRTRREALTLDQIFKQAQAVFAPYQIKIKENTVPDWWAAYQIGQRMSPKFSQRAPDGIDRVFIIGDGTFHAQHPRTLLETLLTVA
jgi:phenol 2-monooxygenase